MQECGPKGPRAFRSAIKEVSICEYVKVAKKFLFQASPWGREVILLQKVDSLLVFLNETKS